MIDTFTQRLTAAYALWSESGGRTPQPFVDLVTDDVQVDSLIGNSMPNLKPGDDHSGMRAVLDYFTSLAERWEVLSCVTERIVDGGETVVWIGHVRHRNRQTLRVLDTPRVDIWTVRDGKAVAYNELLDTYAFAQVVGLMDAEQDA